MSEVRLVVREADRDWSGTIHGSCADRAIAAPMPTPKPWRSLRPRSVDSRRQSRIANFLPTCRRDCAMNRTTRVLLSSILSHGWWWLTPLTRRLA